jgi:hypothetical protein
MAPEATLGPSKRNVAMDLQARSSKSLEALASGGSPLGADRLQEADLAHLTDEHVVAFLAAGWDCRNAVREARARFWGGRAEEPDPQPTTASLDRWT